MNMVIDPHAPHLGGNVRYGDLFSFTPTLWNFLIERFSVKSFLDIGCGEGHVVDFFRRAGVIAHGIDGLEANVRRSVHPIALHDLSKSSYVMPVDMVWSCEVAEHIAEEYVSNFVDTLANGKIIVLTHGLPGQGGHHHVNCQPAEYWITKIVAKGYHQLPDAGYCRDLAQRDGYQSHFHWSGLLFGRAD